QVSELTYRLLGGIAENFLRRPAPQKNAALRIGTDNRDRRGIDDGGKRILGPPEGVLQLLEACGPRVEVVGEPTDLILREHSAAVAELARGEHGGVLAQPAERLDNAPRQRPSDRKRNQQRRERKQRPPVETPDHARQGDLVR